LPWEWEAVGLLKTSDHVAFRPAAAQGLIERDGVASNLTLAYGEGVLLLKEKALRVEHVLKIRKTGGVQNLNQFRRLCQRLHADP
jgi:hypothetical protein